MKQDKSCVFFMLHFMRPPLRSINSKVRRGSESINWRGVVITLLARARRRFFRSADRRGAGPRPGTVLRHRSSAFVMRWEHAVQLPVAERQAPYRPPTLL